MQIGRGKRSLGEGGGYGESDYLPYTTRTMARAVFIGLYLGVIFPKNIQTCQSYGCHGESLLLKE